MFISMLWCNQLFNNIYTSYLHEMTPLWYIPGICLYDLYIHTSELCVRCRLPPQILQDGDR